MMTVSTFCADCAELPLRSGLTLPLPSWALAAISAGVKRTSWRAGRVLSISVRMREAVWSQEVEQTTARMRSAIAWRCASLMVSASSQARTNSAGVAAMATMSP